MTNTNATVRDDDIEPTTQLFDADSASRGTRYRVLRPHARGGLGEVFVALDNELNREVALKEIQSNYADDEGSRLRFVLEAEITGNLEHPGIVPVYGLGQSAEGRPYYAMRFIRGESLGQAVERFHTARAGTPASSANELKVHRSFESVPFRKLLGRFVDVCQAVEYAHSRGILHRDLKPGNVMLGKYGETLVVDWGLAKTLGRSEGIRSAGENTLRPDSNGDSAPTQMGSVLGTPAYMSPEQAEGRLDDLSPASDVYSLGATLYHILTGRPPFVAAHFDRCGVQDDPAREASDLDRRAAQVDILRRVRVGEFSAPRAVAKDIPAPLEAICLRAMKTVAAERYAAPAQLAEEIEAYLADERVAAHTEPFGLRARRWLRKHPRLVAGVASSVLVGLASLAAVLAVVTQSNHQLASANAHLERATRAETRSKELAEAKRVEADQARSKERSAREDAEARREEAESRREEAEAVLVFFQNNVLAAARPKDQEGGLGVDATIRQALDAAEPTIASYFDDKPLVEASIRSTLGRTYHFLGESQAALQQHFRALFLRRSKLGETHPDTLVSMSNVALGYESTGRLAQALPLYQHTLKHRTEQLGEDHPSTLLAMNNLAYAYHSSGRGDLALPLYQRTLERRKLVLGVHHPDTLTSMSNLAYGYKSQGRLDLAVPLYEQTLELRKARLGTEHPQTLTSMHNLAGAYLATQRTAQAIEMYQETLRLRRARLGANHRHTLQSATRLALAYESVGNEPQAAQLHREVVAGMKQKLGPKHEDSIVAAYNLIRVLESMHKYGEAVALHEEAVAVRLASLGRGHSATLWSMYRLAEAYRSAKDVAQAEKTFRECLSGYEQTAPQSWQTFEVMATLARILREDRRFAEAESLMLKAHAGMKTQIDRGQVVPKHRFVSLLQDIVRLYDLWDRPQQALIWQESLRGFADHEPIDAP